MSNSDISYKKFFMGVLWSCLALQLGFLTLDYLIDPIGLWGAPVIRGFNHYKIKQGNFLDVYKPYEYMREKPDILYIGASQMYVGFCPIYKEKHEIKVYSMGLSALSLQDMRDYLRFIYKVHKPTRIYMGISPTAFGRESYNLKREGYSKERLDALTDSLYSYGQQLLKDCLSIHGMYKTVLASWAHKGDGELFLHGWDTKRGGANEIQPDEYYRYMYSAGEKLDYVPEAMDCLKDIVQEAQEAGVTMVVFFTPSSVDRYAVIEYRGHMPEYQRVKREVAEIIPVYDFAVVSELTTNRQVYFYDAAHFRAPLGEKLKPILAGEAPPEPYGYLLTPETADAVLAAETAAWEKWRGENKDYMQILKDCIDSGKAPQVGDFAEHIGF